MHYNEMKRCIKESGKFNDQETAEVMRLYEKEKIFAHSPSTGISVKHGAFLDYAVLRRALKMARGESVK